MLEAIRRRVGREGLQNVETRLGEGSDPNLPARSLDAVLVVDVYPEVERTASRFCATSPTALKPGGRIGIVNYKPGRGGPGPGPKSASRAPPSKPTRAQRDSACSRGEYFPTSTCSCSDDEHGR